MPCSHKASHRVEQIVQCNGSWWQGRALLAEPFFRDFNPSLLEDTDSFPTAGECLFVVQHGSSAVQLREGHFGMCFADISLPLPVHECVHFTNFGHDEERLFGDTDVQLFEVNAKSFREGIALQRLTSGRRKYATTARSAEYLTSYNVADARLTFRKTDRDINGDDTLRTGLTEERLHGR